MKHLIWIAVATTACSSTTTAPKDGELAENRTRMLGWLAEYTERGELPTDERGLPISVMRDAHGVRCPMAELMYRSGHGDLLDAIVAENNQLQLADVHEGPVHDWMLSSGLTRDEIVMIQGIPRDLDFAIPTNQLVPEIRNEVITAQRARVRGRLEMAQTALRKDTRDSLRQAGAALPAGRLPTVRVRGPVLAGRVR